MIQKDKSITNIVKIIKNTFGDRVFQEVDYWDNEFSLGLQKEDKVIYISTAATLENEDYYFYECERLVDDHEKIYISEGYDDCNKQQLLKVISDFFEIKQVR